MSDLHIEICTEIEDVICKELDLEKCQRTYEIASLIFDVMNEKLEGLDLPHLNVKAPSNLHIDHVDTMTIY